MRPVSGFGGADPVVDVLVGFLGVAQGIDDLGEEEVVAEAVGHVRDGPVGGRDARGAVQGVI